MKKLQIISILLFFQIIIGILLCSTIFNLESWAQSVRPAEGQHNFSYYTVENGLVQSAIECMYQDSRGYIWFGTHGGVSRFDGKTFKNFTDKAGLLNYRVLSIAEDHDGNMWFGTTNGLSKFDGTKFTAYTTKNGLPYNFVRSLLVDKDGNLWVGTNKLISYYSQGSTIDQKDSAPQTGGVDTILFKNYQINSKYKSNVIGAMMQDNEDNLWFGALRGGLFKYDPKGTTGDTVIKVSSIAASFGIVEDDDGSIWCVSWSGSIKKFDPHGHDGDNITSFALGSPMIGLTKDVEGNIWIATFERGIFKYDGKVFTNFTTKQGLPINSTWSILHDREGNIWIGTFGSDVCKYNGEKFTYYNEEVGLVNNTINGIIEDRNGNSWFATEGGISKYSPDSLSADNSGFTNFTSIEGLPISRITSVAEDKNGDIWFSHDMARTGGFQFHNNELISVPFNGWMCVYEDHSGNMWFGSGGAGAYRYDGKKKEYFRVEGGRNPNRILCIYEDISYNMWFGTYGGGVNVFNGDTIKNISANESFTYKAVFSITQDLQGNLWFGTDGEGIFKCKFHHKKTLEVIDSFTTQDGLSNDIIASLIFDRSGNLWAATGRGINKFDVALYNKTGKKKFKHYGIQEGFRGTECGSNICIDKKGNLWFGTTKGAVKYNPNADIPNTIEPLTHITAIKLFSGEEDWHPYCDSVNSGMPIGLVLPYNKNHLTFEYIGISLTIPEKVHYRYQLKGFDEKWSSETQETHFTYSNLNPGKYTFKVIACNNDGVWNWKPTTFFFTIKPPYWQSWWFYSAELLFFMALIGGTLIASRKGAGTRTITILVYICLFVIFEFIQNLCEPLYEEYVGSAPIIKTLLNLVLASTLLPVQLFLRKYLRGKQQKGKDKGELM
ncbi:MAG: hypothetical protein FVQ77_00775 [Cytophagales bacterium]|nr:hypothetical protein [Cytophagales bacterium]